MNKFNGLGLDLGNLSRLSDAQTRSCSPENPNWAKGGGGRHVDPIHVPASDLGTGWKVRPCVVINPGETLVLADVDGPGVVQHDFAATIQAIGWRAGGRYLPMQDDIASIAFWYQTEPHAPFPALPDRDGLEII